MPNPPQQAGVLNKKIVGIKGKWWLVGGVGMAGVAYFMYTRASSISTPSATDTASTTDPSIDPATGIPYDEETAYQNGYDGSYGGSPYGSYGSAGSDSSAYDNELLDQIAQDIGGLTDTSSSSDEGDGSSTDASGNANNKHWAHKAIKTLEAEGMHPAAARAAIAGYLMGLPLSHKQVGQVETAVGKLGNPPDGAPRVHQEPPKKSGKHNDPKKGSKHDNPKKKGKK